MYNMYGKHTSLICTPGPAAATRWTGSEVWLRTAGENGGMEERVARGVNTEKHGVGVAITLELGEFQIHGQSSGGTLGNWQNITQRMLRFQSGHGERWLGAEFRHRFVLYTIYNL